MLHASVSSMLKMASGAYTWIRNFHILTTFKIPIMAETGSRICHSAWRCSKMSLRCKWTRQQTVSLENCDTWQYMHLQPYPRGASPTPLPADEDSQTTWHSLQQLKVSHQATPNCFLVQYSLHKACSQILPKSQPSKPFLHPITKLNFSPS